MRSTVLLLLGLCVGVAGTTIFRRHQTILTPSPAVETVSTPAPARPERITVAPRPAPPVTEARTEPVSVSDPVTNTVANAPEYDADAAFRKTIDTLLSNPRQKQELIAQLRKNNQLDQAIDELKRRQADNPNDPAIPTTLGEVMLNKVAALHESGADVNEVGILAMQADQSFNAALKIDPSNWEAQFVKYSSMYYWPPDAARDNEVAQKLSSLIDRQESMPQNPYFAQTYVVLGNQYQKMGRLDLAEATWRLGLAQYPSDPTLLKKVAAQR